MPAYIKEDTGDGREKQKGPDESGPESNGSGSWIRTSDQVVNSHLLYR